MTTDSYRGSPWTGWVIFAAAVLLTIGAIDIIQGLAALLKDDVYLVTKSGLLVTTNFTAWGWSLIIWGVVLILAGLALFSGKEWGRWFAIVALVVNGIVQIAWFPAYPLWSLVAIGLEIAVLYALTAGWKGAKVELRRLRRCDHERGDLWRACDGRGDTSGQRNGNRAPDAGRGAVRHGARYDRDEHGHRDGRQGRRHDGHRASRPRSRSTRW